MTDPRMTDPEPHLRAEIRPRAPCPICQQPAFLDPPCTITDMRTGAVRVEQHINCSKCNTAYHYKPGMTRSQQAVHQAKQANGKQANGATLCGCGCGQYARPGRPYLKGHKLNPVPSQVLERQEEEPMSSPPMSSPPFFQTCPCGCGEPLPPGRQYAGRGCVGRARKGVPIPPDVLARRSETIRKAIAAKKHESIELTPPVNTEPMPEAPCTHQLDGSNVLTYTPEIQKLAKQALDALRKAEQSACPYQTVATLASQHTAKTLRVAADLREALEVA